MISAGSVNFFIAHIERYRRLGGGVDSDDDAGLLLVAALILSLSATVGTIPADSRRNGIIS